MDVYLEQNSQNEEPEVQVLPKILYRCGGCERLVKLTRKDPVTCVCGMKVLYKVRDPNQMMVYDGR